MIFDNLNFLNFEERLSVRLKSLYKSCGYKEYRLSGFDEYSLYADNQSFIGGKEVISFSSGGKLLTLRPDVTLSIVKNGRFGGGTQKLFYDEKVYRKTTGGKISEVSQIGVEIIGEADVASQAELCSLMLKTLAEAGKEYVLDLSHTGIVSKTLEYLGLSAEDNAYVLKCLESKSVHSFKEFAKSKRLDGNKAEAFEMLMTVPAKNAKKVLEKLNESVEISEEINEIDAVVSCIGEENINVDFSIVGDTEYYNGLIFKGYVNGVPHAVLTGGRYDKLLKKFGKSEQAMGFALYLGELCAYTEESPARPDAVLLYSSENALTAFKRAEELRKSGISLLLSKTVPEGFDGKIYYAEGCDD